MTIGEILVTIADVMFETFCMSLFVVVMFCFLNKNDNKYFNKKTFLKFYITNLFIGATSKIIQLYFPDFKWLKSILFIVYYSINASMIYKSKVYKGIISTVSFLVIAAILEVVSVLVLKALNIMPHDILNNTYYNSIYACSIALLEACIALFIFNYNKNLSGVENKFKYFIPQLIAIIICLVPSMLLLILNYYEYSALFIFINLTQLLVVSFVGIYNLKFVVKHEDTELELANTITYNETLKKVNEGVRGFKHDMGNIVQAILGYIAINDSEGAKKYCQNLVIGFNDINILSILSPKVIDDPAIYGVVVNKILIARDKDMTLSLDINTSVADINFSKFELSRILGVLLDNAIEAGEQSEEKKLVLNMRHDHDRNVDIIVISNSIKDTNIDINKIFEKNYSTKNNPSGFGLYEVNKFLRQNPQAYIVTTMDKDEKMFTQTLTISSKLQPILLDDMINEDINQAKSTVA